MQNKFSRDFVKQKDKEKQAKIPPRVIIPGISGEKHGLEYPDMRAFVLKVVIGSIVVSVAFFSALYYFSHN